MAFLRSCQFVLIASAALATWQAPASGQGTTPDLKTLARQSLAKIDGELNVPGLRQPVEIIRDKWGVTHIYAKNQDDMFFAQGYVMGQDRLWQLYMWKMEHEGRLSEILGPEALARDEQTREGLFRGPYDDKEWNSYHADGKRIFVAWTKGLNAYIKQHMDNLPIEFKMTGLKPELWTPETPLLRSGPTRDAGKLARARLVRRVGALEATREEMPDPWSLLTVPDGLDLSALGNNPPGSGDRGFLRGPPLPSPEIIAPYRRAVGAMGLASSLREGVDPDPGFESNNWAVSGRFTVTGKPIVSNDPHRQVGNPSLRYISHLVSPGWNIIGSMEPPFVGVALGHNERVAWGLTIAGNDQTDTYVEETNPDVPNEVKYNGAWEPLKIIREVFKIKGESPRTVEFKYSRHGPIIAEDSVHHRAYAIRSTMLEPGTAPYLGGLRLDQATDCKEFQAQAMYWKEPTENLLCGDVEGNITLQSSALTPNRPGWDGRMPVPGTGKYEWDGFRKDLPKLINPVAGFIATANNNINTTGYWPPVMFKSMESIPFERAQRIKMILRNQFYGPNPTKFTVRESEEMQHDVYMLQAAYDQDVFKGWTGKTAETEKARAMIVAWNAKLDKESAAAAIYQAWRGKVDREAYDFHRPLAERRPLAEAGLVKAIAELTDTQGSDWSKWHWGAMHKQSFDHPFVKEFDLPTIERSGGTNTLLAGGATYREVMDVADWDRSTTMNVPGQSEQPESEFYGNLLPYWDKGEFFPMLYTRGKIDQNTSHKMTIKPAPLH